MSPIGSAAQDADLLLVGPPSTRLVGRSSFVGRSGFAGDSVRPWNATWSTDDPGSDSNAELAPESLTDLPLGFTPEQVQDVSQEAR